VKSHPSEKTRHMVLRAEAGEVLPDALAKALDDSQVACGWVRGSGVLTDVQLRAFATELGAPAATRRIAGPVQAISLEGSVGFARGNVSVGLRAVLARETDRGMETMAGEIVAATVIALEAHVIAFDDLALPRALDPSANVWMLGEVSGAKPKIAASEEAPAPKPIAPVATPNWSEAIAASADAAPLRGGATRGTDGAVVPPRPVRTSTHTEGPIPEAGDSVEHFAFGRADVVKSDGERLHLRADKDGRIREIALEMLRVTPLESIGGQRRFRLDRKL
jgi:predicted DNA-binding protein with PD1-like motif